MNNKMRVRSELYKKQRCRCFWCGEWMLPISMTKNEHPSGVSIEHLLPKRFGGKNNRGNLVAVHKGCNQKRDIARYELEKASRD